MPETIQWQATDERAGSGLPRKNCQALLVSLWDKHEKNTLSIDLWTKDMEVGDMQVHIFQTFMKMADTYTRATGEKEQGDFIRQMAREFADKAGLFQDKKD